MATTVTTTMNDRLDRICYAYYGSTANRQVETVLEANPGLELYGLLLPINLSITLPDITTSSATPVVSQIKLWN